jgi:hypothetical protein
MPTTNNPMLEMGKLPQATGISALLEVLHTSHAPISLGQVCGGRVAAVWLGDGLEVVSCTLEPHELDDPEHCRSRALEFLAALP